MTMTAGDGLKAGRTINVELVTRAHPDRVWEALTNPARVVEWLADRVDGTAEPGTVLTWHFDAMGSAMTHMVDPATVPGRLVLCGQDGTPGRLEITVGPAHDGTRMALVQSALPGEPAFDNDFRALAAGWRLAMAVLRYYAEFQFGQARRNYLASRGLRCPPGRLQWLFHDPAGLKEWLTHGGSMGTPGGRVHLVLQNGANLRGDMLADAGTDLAMAWDEISGVLQLRSFPVKGDRDQCLVYAMGWGWGITAEQALDVEQELGLALARLEAAAEAPEGQGTPGLGAAAPTHSR